MDIKVIDGATRNLGAPAGWDPDKDGICDVLPIRDEPYGDGTPRMVSEWQPSAEEAALLAAGAPILLSIVGYSHPPVMLSVGEARVGLGQVDQDLLEWVQAPELFGIQEVYGNPRVHYQTLQDGLLRFGAYCLGRGQARGMAAALASAPPAPTPDAGSDLAKLDAKATPGPWLAERTRAFCGVYSDDATGSVIGRFNGFTFAPRPEDEQDANAALACALVNAYRSGSLIEASASPPPAEDLAGQGESVVIHDPLVEIAPDARKGKEPCGECHISPGETCDICGATAPAPPDRGRGEPVAWAWEQTDGYTWFARVDTAKPPLGPCLRDLRPLYAAPAPSQPADRVMYDPTFVGCNELRALINAVVLAKEALHPTLPEQDQMDALCDAVSELEEYRDKGALQKDFWARHTPSRPADREEIARVIRTALIECGFGKQPIEGVVRYATRNLLALRDAPRTGGDGWRPGEAPADGQRVTLSGVVSGRCSISPPPWITVRLDGGPRISVDAPFACLHAEAPPSPNAGDGTQSSGEKGGGR